MCTCVCVRARVRARARARAIMRMSVAPAQFVLRGNADWVKRSVSGVTSLAAPQATEVHRRPHVYSPSNPTPLGTRSYPSDSRSITPYGMSIVGSRKFASVCTSFLQAPTFDTSDVTFHVRGTSCQRPCL